MLLNIILPILSVVLGTQEPGCVVLNYPMVQVRNGPPICSIQNVRLVYEIDYSYYQSRGYSTINCQNDANTLFSRINPIFERDLNIHLVFAGAIIHTTNDGIFNGDGYSKVSQLNNRWTDPVLRNIYKPNCVQLISGASLGTPIGIAYIGSVSNIEIS